MSFIGILHMMRLFLNRNFEGKITCSQKIERIEETERFLEIALCGATID